MDTSELRPVQVKALEMLLSGHTQKEAADAIGMDKANITHWKKEPAFARALAQGQREMVEAALRRFTSKAGKAAQVVEDVMSGKIEGSEARTRLSAAQMVLDRVGMAGPQPGDAAAQDPQEAGRKIAAIYGMAEEPEQVSSDDNSGAEVVPLKRES